MDFLPDMAGRTLIRGGAPENLEEGGEMGRAQVVQARAACVPPHTDMNPVLLKPLGKRGSQVIEWLCRRKGVPAPAGGFELTGSADEFDRLADAIEEHVNLGPLDRAWDGLLARPQR